MEHHRRHVFVWRFLRPLAKFIGWLLFNHTAVPAGVKGPFLFVCNHNTDLDPVLAGCSFREQIYYVTSEHLIRQGFFGKLVMWLQAPIPRQKGGSAADTVLTVLRRLKRGCNVGLFPEGNRSWDGVTQPFPASTGKLVRSAAAAGASLVTYRLDGGYFANPRWAGGHIRRGKTVGHVINVYSPAQLRALSAAQINDLLSADLYDDAYARQREHPLVFRGRRLAEHMETLFYLCPVCGGVHTLRSRGDTVTCESCGLHLRYLPTGFLESGQLPWDNIRDWNLWQQEQICALCDRAGSEAIFTDSDMICGDVEKAKDVLPLGAGDMALYRDRLELPGLTLPLEDITGIALRGPQDIYFGTAEHNYVVRSDAIRCVVRYLTAINHLKGESYGV